LEPGLKVDDKNIIYDYMVFFMKIEKAPEKEYSILRWSALYKSMNAFRIMIRDFEILKQ
jgi:hypothetical protein